MTVATIPVQLPEALCLRLQNATLVDHRSIDDVLASCNITKNDQTNAVDPLTVQTLTYCLTDSLPPQCTNSARSPALAAHIHRSGPLFVCAEWQ
jgi:hypothetical protein